MIGAWLALLGLIAGWPPATADVGRPRVTVQIEEQSACRLLAGGYMLAFTLRTSYATPAGTPIAIAVPDQTVARAEVTWKDAEAVTFASSTALDVDAVRLQERTVTVRPGQPVESTATAHIPLSTRPSDWPTALLPGHYRVRFTLRMPIVHMSGTIAWVETATESLPIQVFDPTVVQECPFDMAPRDLLVAESR